MNDTTSVPSEPSIAPQSGGARPRRSRGLAVAFYPDRVKANAAPKAQTPSQALHLASGAAGSARAAATAANRRALAPPPAPPAAGREVARQPAPGTGPGPGPLTLPTPPAAVAPSAPREVAQKPTGAAPPAADDRPARSWWRRWLVRLRRAR